MFRQTGAKVDLAALSFITAPRDYFGELNGGYLLLFSGDEELQSFGASLPATLQLSKLGSTTQGVFAVDNRGAIDTEQLTAASRQSLQF